MRVASEYTVCLNYAVNYLNDNSWWRIISFWPFATTIILSIVDLMVTSYQDSYSIHYLDSFNWLELVVVVLSHLLAFNVPALIATVAFRGKLITKATIIAVGSIGSLTIGLQLIWRYLATSTRYIDGGPFDMTPVNNKNAIIFVTLCISLIVCLTILLVRLSRRNDNQLSEHLA